MGFGNFVSNIGQAAQAAGNAVAGGAQSAAGAVGGAVAGAVTSTGDQVVMFGNLAAASAPALGNELNNGINSVKNQVDQWIQDGKDAAFKAAAELASSQYARLIEEATASIPKIGSCSNNLETQFIDTVKDPTNIDTLKLGNLLVDLMKCGAFQGVIQEAQNQNFGSLLIMVSAGAAKVVGIEGTVGVAISLAAAEIGRKFAVFAAGGLSIGASAGGSTDLILGFNRNYPKGCGGATFDVNLEIQAGQGGNIGISFDPALPPNMQQLTVGVSAGAKVNLSVGAGFTHIIAVVDAVERYAFKTPDGHYMCVWDGGGHGDGGAPLESHRTAIGGWEQFDLIEVDRGSRKYALKTHSGNYITFNGGGNKNQNGRSAKACPVTTSASQPQGWEKLRMIPMPSGKVAFMTHNGQYLSARSGGGHGGSYPIHTDATQRGGHETFTMVKL